MVQEDDACHLAKQKAKREENLKRVLWYLHNDPANMLHADMPLMWQDFDNRLTALENE